MDEEATPQAYPEGVAKIHEQLEKASWAPWLQFSLEDMAEHHAIFPDGQFVDYEGENPTAALTTTRTRWDGSAQGLLRWDDYAGINSSFQAAYDPQGNTMVMLSISGLSADHSVHTWAIGELQKYAQQNGIDHIVGDFRPANFGTLKARTGNCDFEAYCWQTREDGQLADNWLRVLKRSGMRELRTDPRAMVVKVGIADFDAYRTTYHPERWKTVEDVQTVEQLEAYHRPDMDIEHLDEVWECQETGTWYVDRKNNQAVYIESNLWGELPVTGATTRE